MTKKKKSKYGPTPREYSETGAIIAAITRHLNAGAGPRKITMVEVRHSAALAYKRELGI